MNLLSRILLDWVLPTVAVLVVAIPNLDHAPSYDEVLHYDAAIGLIEHGDVSIAQGRYSRAVLYTALVAASFQTFGVSDVAARVPSVVASVVWALLLYNFTRKVASRGAAWIGLIIFVSAPTFILITQMSRFYSLHGMFFLLAAITLFAAIKSRTNLQRLWLALACVLSLTVSLHLQMTTLIGGAALATWLVAISLPYLLAAARKRPAHAMLACGILTGVAIIAFLLVPWTRIVAIAMETPYWASGKATAYLYYARSLGSDFGFVWLTFPFLAVAGYRRFPSVVWYSSVILGVALIVHSLAGPKASRYMAYVFPFICIVAGISLAELVGRFKSVALEVSRLTVGKIVPERIGSIAIVSACFAFVIMLNPNTSDAVSGIFDPDASSLAGYHSREADWRQVHDTLSLLAENMPTLVASSGTKALFYVGYYDYELNVSVVYETETGEEFGTDLRTGGLVIGTLESLQSVVACSHHGLAIFDESKYRVATHVSPAVADFIEQALVPVPVPSSANLRVYTWTSPPDQNTDCDTLPRSRSTMTHE